MLQGGDPRRPLLVVAVVGLPLLAALVAGTGSAGDLVRATSACFVMVYVAATASAVRILHGVARAAALVSCALAIVVALFSGWYLLVPAVSWVLFFALRTKFKPR